MNMSKKISNRILKASRDHRLENGLMTLNDIEKQYLVFYSEETEGIANDLNEIDSDKYVLAHMIQFNRFPDRSLKGFIPDLNEVRDRDILYLASLSRENGLYEDYAALLTIAQAFGRSLTVVVPFFPSGTMERVQRVGEIATASVDSFMLSSLPAPSGINRFVIFDLHTLANKHFFQSSADLVSAMTAVPAAVADWDASWCVCFPDDGALKRFSSSFEPENPRILCGKVRQGTKRIVHIQEGEARGRRVLIVDDLVRSGGTLIECMKVLLISGAKEVCAFVTHPVFPGDSFRRFLAGGDGEQLAQFYTTNTIPPMAEKLKKEAPEKFTIIPIAPILDDSL